jgi:hypothetical protein
MAPHRLLEPQSQLVVQARHRCLDSLNLVNWQHPDPAHAEAIDKVPGLRRLLPLHVQTPGTFGGHINPKKEGVLFQSYRRKFL